MRRATILLIAAIGIAAITTIAACKPNPTTPVSVVAVEPRPATGPEVPDGPPMFRDVTDSSGVAFSYRNGEESKHYAILESLGGGGALIDFDGDGKLDLFIAGGGYYDGPEKKTIRGHLGRLYRNLGGMKFEDVTAKVMPDQPDFYTHGCAVGDYDRDGWTDLLVTGYGRVALLHNEPDSKGGRKLVDVTQKAGLLSQNSDQKNDRSGQPGTHFWSTSASLADLDGDGFPDLYVCQYVNWSFYKDDKINENPKCPGYSVKYDQDVCPPKQFESRPHALYRNRGDGSFEDVSKSAGLRLPPREDKDYGKGLGVLIVDVDGDGKPDLYVANDTTDNFLYLNRSQPGKLSFEEKGLSLGVARDHNGTPNGSMGVDAGAFDGSGRPSIWVTNYEAEYHALYKNVLTNNRLAFTFSTMTAGLSVIGPNFVGFGTVFVDVDRDGWEDIVVSNGHVVHHPPRENLRQRAILFLNLPYQSKSGVQRRFVDAQKRGGSYFAGAHRGRGLAVGDLDNDGRPDLVFINVNEPVTVLRNEAASESHWLGIELAGKDKRDVVGARLTLEVGDRKLVRFVRGGRSYLSAHDMRTVFGLGDATKIGKLTIEWPHAEPREQVVADLAIDKYHRIEQGK